MNKKIPLVLSFTLAAILVVGQAVFAENPSDNGIGSMMNGSMSNMMAAMNSPEGEEMIRACSNFMDSYEDNE